MRILVTGAEGFIGSNLCLRLAAAGNDELEIIRYDQNDTFSVIEDGIEEFDYIFHLAGINRPETTEEFYSGNTNFTQSLVKLMRDRRAKAALIISSSIQAALDNDYGKSKKLAEEAVFSLRDTNKVFVFRLHNVFGKWSRPHYNSVVSTFCYNIMRGEPITVTDPERVMELVYIDDIVDEFLSITGGEKPRLQEGDYCYITPKYEITLGDLAEMIRGFKAGLSGTRVPETGDDFTRKLFSTFFSYAGKDEILYNPKVNTDHRGSFTELINTASAGQVSVSVSKPGVKRGNHFHDTKLEKFMVLSGKAVISFRHVITSEKMVFEVSGDQPQIVTIPPGYTHNIENRGEGEMVLLIWANENFDPARPDTFFEEV